MTIAACPWCSAEVPQPAPERCPSCGASLVEAPAEDVPGLTRVDPEAILALTFTRQATAEMEGRIRHLLADVVGGLEGLTIKTNLFGSTFFTLTGTHGAHVAVGVLWLLTLLVRSFQGKLGQEKALNVEIAGLYWHFVDVVWIVIFTVVYLLQ